MTKQRKPFLWRKLTPAQISLMERMGAADDPLPYGKLGYGELLALSELQKLGLADMRPKGRKKLEVFLTSAGKELRADAYLTDRVIVRVTGPQIDFLRHLLDGPIDDSVGQPMRDLPGMMLDICRRMVLRGWVDWYDGWDGQRWAKLTTSGREVLDAVGVIDNAIIQFDEERRRRGLL
jgi:hypothetical protein